jgi:catechol 2,3-dioxygenase-like lactoylglutathione lyase family enzyme
LIEKSPRIDAIDHLVLTVSDIQTTCDFYQQVLGATPITFGQGRRALQIGRQKINLHQAGHEFMPKASHATPGSADLCFLSDDAIQVWLPHLTGCGVEVIQGPVARTGAQGPIQSIYIRDPDGNLIEIANQG